MFCFYATFNFCKRKLCSLPWAFEYKISSVLYGLFMQSLKMTFLLSNYFIDRTNKSLLKYLKWRWIYFIRLRYHLRNYNQSCTLIAPIRTSSFQRDNFELGLTEWVVLPIDRGCSESWRNLSLHPWCERLCFSFTLSNALTNHLLLLGSLRCISN